jgi:threonine synthase
LHAVGKLRRYGGGAVTVSDGEILAAQKTLSAGSGLFAEPSSSAAFAGWLKVRDRVPAGDNCVVLITGSGLKDVKSAAQGLGLAI